jgi:flagellar basal body-associated protein FliL
MKDTSTPPKQKTVFIILGIITVILVFIVAGYIYLGWLFGSGMASGMCGNDVFQEVYSPNKQYKVIVFERDCGATTGFSTQISILEATQALSNVTGNIFIMDGNPDYTNVQVKWENDQAINITYADGYEVSYHQETFRDLSRVFEIQYRATSNK